MFIVGFDLGKRKSQICVQDPQGNVLAEIRVATVKSALTAALHRYPQSRVLLESSTSSEWVAEHLESLGCDVVVGDPRFSPMYAHANKKIKTDKRDAKALGDARRMGAFRPAHRRSARARELYTMLLVRSGLVSSRTRLINLVRATAEREGICIGLCSKGAMFVDVLAEHEFPSWLADALAPMIEEIAGLTERIDTLDQVLDRFARMDPIARNLMTAPGVGPVTALTFIAVVDDPHRFSSATELVAYLGLAPGQRNSAESKRRPGAITKAGNSLLRGHLYEAALALMRVRRSTSPLQDWALKLKAKHHDMKRKAIVGTARRLARVMWAMWRDDAPFNPKLTASIVTPALEKVAG